MIWEKIRGHREHVDMFRRAIARGRLSHAYLFVGPEGVGKNLFACSLAQCLLCERFEAAELEACGECPSCRRAMAGTHPNLHFVSRPPDKAEIPVAEFIGSPEKRGREGLLYEMSLRPGGGERRIAIIDDCDHLNEEGANSLLKTLEEPGPDSLLILVATKPAGVLPTILSRCQLVRFPPLETRDVAELILEEGLVDDRPEAQTIAELSDGSLDSARRLLDPVVRAHRDRLYQQLAAVPYNGVKTAQVAVEGMQEQGIPKIDQREAARLLVRFTVDFFERALVLLAGGGPVHDESVRRFASRFPPGDADALERIADSIERADLADEQLSRNVGISLCLEALYCELGSAIRVPDAV